MKTKDIPVASISIRGIPDMTAKQARHLCAWLTAKAKELGKKSERANYSRRLTAKLFSTLVAVSMLAGCQTGPTAADVAADRDRWAAVRDVTADHTVDAIEAPLVAELLAAWDAKLSADEAKVASADTTVADLLRVYGSAAVTIWVVPELQKRAPEFFRLVDKDGNGTLSDAELLAIDPKSPVFAAVVLTTAARLIAKK